jgi:hypothetical protein
MINTGKKPSEAPGARAYLSQELVKDQIFSQFPGFRKPTSGCDSFDPSGKGRRVINLKISY